MRQPPPPQPSGEFGEFGPTGGYVPPAPRASVVRVTDGFGPAGSGSGVTGQTPVPVRHAEPREQQPPKAEQPAKRPSYLVEGDDDEMFGNDEFTAPPVIGE